MSAGLQFPSRGGKIKYATGISTSAGLVAFLSGGRTKEVPHFKSPVKGIRDRESWARKSPRLGRCYEGDPGKNEWIQQRVTLACTRTVFDWDTQKAWNAIFFREWTACVS